VVEAKVAPQDIDQIAEGARAMVRVMAGNQRTTPEITGKLVRVSADLTKETQPGPMAGMTYYTVRIALSEAEVKNLPGLRLVPGMPTEAFIQTDVRTPLGYLLKPLMEQIARTFRER
jgi:HlyD family secretion protein